MTRLINIAIPKSGSGMLAQAIGGEHANIGPSAYKEQPAKPTLRIMREFNEPFARSHQPYHLEYENLYRERKDLSYNVEIGKYPITHEEFIEFLNELFALQESPFGAN